ncbi:unnamed protein product [Ascophyllum nodosum]
MAARCFIRYVTDEGCCGKNGEEAKVNGVAQTSDTLGLRSLCTADGSRAASLMLPAGTPEQRAEVDSWVDFATTFSAEHVAGVDRHLSGRSFLAGGAFSLADVAAYFACAGVVAAADASFSKKNFSRWFNHVQHRVKNMAPSCKALPAVVTLDLFTPVPVPLPPKPAAASNTEGKSKEGSPGTPEADRTPTGANGGAEPSTNNHKKDKKKDKKKKKEGRENANGEAPPPAAAAGGADGVDGAKAGVGGSSAAEAQASTAEPAAAQGDPSKLDVRVGVIVKAWSTRTRTSSSARRSTLARGSTAILRRDCGRSIASRRCRGGE